MDLFSVKDYRDFLRHQIKISEAGWGLVTKMSKAAGCQRSHLSRVVNASSNLTPDQAYGLCQFWKFDLQRTEYFMKLVELSRAGTKSYSERLKSELQALKKKHESVGERLGIQPAQLGGKDAVYYGAWFMSAIHIIVSIPEFRTSTAISRRLDLPVETVEICLRQLSEMGLVHEHHGKWEFKSTSVHLRPESPMRPVHHANWKERALIALRTPSKDGLHYSVVQSVSREDFQNIKDLFLEAIDKYRALAEPSDPEDLVALNLDFFRV